MDPETHPVVQREVLFNNEDILGWLWIRLLMAKDLRMSQKTHVSTHDAAADARNDDIRIYVNGEIVHRDEAKVSVFDSSVQRGEPATFRVNQVIKGWQMALQEMKVGDKWMLYIPSDLAYGERGSQGAIGPNEVLVFEVELLAIQ